jgi:hypothetical protein
VKCVVDNRQSDWPTLYVLARASRSAVVMPNAASVAESATVPAVSTLTFASPPVTLAILMIVPFAIGTHVPFFWSANVSGSRKPTGRFRKFST